VTPERVAEILLVQAAEEAAPDALAPEVRIDALEAAGDLDEETAWFARRARWLLEHPLATYLPLLRVRDLFAPGVLWGVGLPFAVGLSSNALGPREQIHVVYNPIVLLVAWNLIAYAGLVVLALRGPPRLELPTVRAPDVRAPDVRVSAPRGGLAFRLIRRGAAGLWLRALRASAAAREEGRAWVAVGGRFFELWERAARPWFALRTRRILHGAALGLGLGAIAGMYVRGLFFEYEMVWRSTFVREPEAVARALGWLLAPASALLGRPAPGVPDAVALLAPEGVAAAPWIHGLAVTALLVVVVPRALLALHASWRLRRIGPRLALGLDGAYFTDALAEARAIQVGRVKEAIGSAVREEGARFADDLAGFVTTALYDTRIVPELERFRAEGGSVAGLEERIRASCTAFEPELAAHVKSAEQAFEEDLARDVLERVRPDLALPPSGAGRLGEAARDLPTHSVRDVGGDVVGKLSRDFGTAVTLAVGAAAGTLSGGFGAHLGAAILVTLLHTSGPVGFLIGALGGALVAAGALVAGRERVDAFVRATSLPGPVVRLALRQGRFDRLVARGRERCAGSVRELVGDKLAPLTDELADQVWVRVKPLLARGAAAEPPAAGAPG
jgi:hypothetical protein